MTTFFRLIDLADKETPLKELVSKSREGETSDKAFDVNPSNFSHVPGSPFSYWTSNSIRFAFKNFSTLESETRTAKQGLASGDDYRFVRLSWEVTGDKWVDFAKGGQYSPHYADIYLKVNWDIEGREITCFNGSVIRNKAFYSRPALTWPRRTTSGLSIRPMAEGCIFADKGPAIFVENNKPEQLLAIQAIISSASFTYLLGIQLAAADSAARSYEVGLMQQTPIPELTKADIEYLSLRAHRAWEIKFKLDSVNEISHAFYLPQMLQDMMGSSNFEELVQEYNDLVGDIDEYCFKLFSFNATDQTAAKAQQSNVLLNVEDSTHDNNKQLNASLSWAVGCAFGRFNEKVYLDKLNDNVPSTPFSILPGKSFACTGAELTHEFLVDEAGAQIDLVNLVEETLTRAGLDISLDVRSWLSKQFFSYHLGEYTQSRRVAPIYWPLESKGGRCSIWIYIESLTNQTLYKIINDYVLPKLKDIEGQYGKVSLITNRNSKEEQELSTLKSDLEDIKEFRDDLVNIAEFWKPNLDDGVQITAAPLWKLFQHKAWQSKLKNTWQELEQGKLDWSNMAFHNWPERVLKKCHQDRSVSVAHGVEDDLWHEIEVPATRGKGTKLEWQPRELTHQEYSSFVQQQVARLKET
jgi:hypothetical protein